LSLTAIVLVLAAAIAHASWNLFGKQAAATGAAFFIWLIAIGVTGIYLPVVAVTAFVTHPQLSGLNWLFLAGTGVLHAGYFLFLQLGYRLGDLSVGYPIGRGTGAMLAALAGVLLLGERPSLIGGAGILAIVGGVVVIGAPERPGVQADPVAADPMAADPVATDPVATDPVATDPAAAEPPPGPPALPGTARPSARGAIAFALVTGVFIACYTIWDKYAVANLHTEPVLQGYAGFPMMALVFTPFVLRDQPRLAQVWKSFRPQVIGAALLSPLAYILVLIALSFTAVSAVAPAREVSVLFGVLLGRHKLGEGRTARRLAAAAAIVAGIIAVAVG
jgi:drug/metabolite transporter (DMT)-like permease